MIFDLEGVLADTRKYQHLTWEALCGEQGLRFDGKLAEQLMGKSRDEGLELLIRKARRPYTEAEKLALKLRKSDLFMEYTEHMDEKDIFPGALETIAKLKVNGIKTAVISSGFSGRYILRKTGLIRYFQIILDGSDIKKAKPDPEIYRLAAQKLHAAYDECMVADDSEDGIRAAKKLGMKTVALGSAAACDTADYRSQSLETIDLCTLL